MEGVLNPIIITRTSLKFPATLVDIPSPIRKVSKPISSTNPKAQTISTIIKKQTRPKYRTCSLYSGTNEKLHLTNSTEWRGGGVNIAHYNSRHVFIDLDNELDYNTIWTQQRMTIEGKLMRIQAWTPNFRLEEETPIVPTWVLLS
ncbi:hypothetical protein H5410_027316 [Solanum commersonii]|uniref:DUF4283 domain-containing protein n=1 Tax=Solanum commersonii TaxID=4109 RepID=A0A9J5Z1I0_SOLCO|nr:hypothetical protein H5410_027316 [Solanum commersonii]